MTRSGYPEDWDERRRTVYARDDYTCQHCGARGGPHGDVELHAHHVEPRSEGGSHAVGNLRTLCVDCHNSQHAHDITRDTNRRPRQRGQTSGFEAGWMRLGSLFLGAGRHLVLPVVAGLGYFYVLDVVTNATSAVHWLVSLVAMTAVATVAGVVGLLVPLVVVEAYVLLGGILAWYLVDENQVGAFVSELSVILAGAPGYEVIASVPVLLYALFGPLCFLAGAWLKGAPEET